MIVIIDYGMGNLHSVEKALLRVAKEDVLVTSDPEMLRKADRLLLPGVGAFGQGMLNLSQRRLIEPIRDHISQKKKPFFGICLGMQLLAERSFEKGEHEGLGIISGTVTRLELPIGFKVPHVGWNTIETKNDASLLQGYLGDRTFYFVHSYHFMPTDASVVAATTDYGIEIVAAILYQNIFATQFHPEKSQKNGLRLLKQFVEWNPC